MRKIAILLLFVAISTSLYAQNSKIVTGILNVRDNKYADAVQNLTTGLSDLSALKQKNIPKGYINLTKAYMSLAVAEGTKANYPNGLLDAQAAYAKAVENKEFADKATKQLIENTQLILKTNIYNAAAAAFNEASQAQEETVQQEKYALAASHFKAACELDQADYNSRVMAGYSNLSLGDTTTALSYLDEGINMYTSLEEKPATPASNVGQAIVQASLLNMYSKNTRKALDLIETGKGLFGMESESEKQINDNLDRIQLAIYTQNPDLFEEARSKFEEAIKSDPSDLEVKIAYASMLSQREEQADKDYSLKLYREILTQDEDNYQANANVGVFYINEAANLSSKMMEEDDDEKIKEFETKVVESLRQAYPYINKAHEQKPEFIEWVKQLVNITSYVPEYMGELTKWSDLQRKLISEQSKN